MQPRRRPAAITLAVSVLLLAGTAVASADTSGATVDKTGWWNRANSSQSTPAGPVTVPPPPGVPEGALVVSAAAGSPTALTAVGLRPDADTGATVEEFVLTMHEDGDAEGNRGTSSATIVACPITSFWAGGENGEWDTRPEYDCEAAAVAGERDDEGAWTFDLRPIGTLWFDPFATIVADGVVLVVAPESDRSFQAVLRGDDIDVVFRAQEPADAGDDPFALPTPPDPPADAGLSSGPTGGGSSLFSPPVITTPPSTAPPTVPTTTTPAADDADERAAPLPGQPVVQRSPGRAGDILGNLPVGAVLLLPLGLALLLITSYWLGPAGQPTTTVRRGGVSRVLEARARAAEGS